MRLPWLFSLLTVANACHKSCLSCVGSAANECTSCGLNALLVPAHSPYIGSCLCANGYCARPDAMHCTNTCHPSCSACTGCAQNKCTACLDAKASMGKKTTTGECKCDTGNWCKGPDASGLCQPGCDDEGCISCSKCSKCSKCATNAGGKDCKCSAGKVEMFDRGYCVSSCGANMIKGTTCTCVSGYYEKADHTCGACNGLCLTCVGPGSGDCKSCKNSYAQISGDPGPCTCIRGYYPNSNANSCSPCDSSCDHCNGPGLSACYSCLGGVVLSGAPPNICKCATSQFWDGSTCTSCDASCKTCTTAGTDKCLTCVDSSMSPDTLPGTCACADGFYQAATCLPCDASCKTCNGGGNTNCLTCFSHATKTLSGDCKCNSGYWPDSFSNNCSLCDVSCETCSSGTSCDLCIPNASSTGGLCTCDDTFYFEAVFSQCSSCDASCFTCSDATSSDCLSCYSNASLSLGMCECGPGYTSVSPGHCQVCASSCATCSHPSPNMCLSCFDFAHLSGSSPSPCVCAPTAFPNPDIQHCSLCASTCRSCVSATDFGCTSCYVGAELRSASPSSCECLPGYFPSPDSARCSKCEKMCLTCLSSSICESCERTAELTVDSSCACKEGYYGEAWNCVTCLEGCLACNEVGCIRCMENWYFLDSRCMATCPQGYIVKDGICEQGDLTPPEPYMLVNSDNSLLISFSKPIHMNLTASDILIIVTDVSDISYSLVWSEPRVLDQSQFILNLTLDSLSLPNDNECLLTFLRPVIDLLGVALVKNELFGALYGYGNDQIAIDSAENATVKATAAAAAQGSVGAVAVTSIMGGNPASFWSLLNQLQLITYIPMTSLPIPSKLMTTLGALNVGTMVPNPFAYILPANVTSQQPPDYAQRYEVESSLFLLNTGLMMTTALVLLLSFIPIYVLSQFSTGFLIQYLRRFLPSFRWGIPLRWWIQSYLDITIYSLLQIQQVLSHNGLSEVVVCLNFLLSLLLACLSIITPVISYVFLWKHYSQMVTRDYPVFNKRWGVLYMEFHQVRGIDGLIYYPLFLTRRLIYALTIIWLYDYPKIQAVINTALAFAVLFTQTFLYILAGRPFQERLDQLGAVLGEVSTLAVFCFSCSFFLSLSPSVSENIEAVAVWTVLTSIGVNAVLSTFRSLITFANIYKEYKQSVKTQHLITVIPTFQTQQMSQSKES